MKTVRCTIFFPSHSATSSTWGLWHRALSKPLSSRRPAQWWLRCNMHKDMIGTLFVVPNGYYTKVDANGDYQFENIKSDDYIMQVWGSDAGS